MFFFSPLELSRNSGSFFGVIFLDGFFPLVKRVFFFFSGFHVGSRRGKVPFLGGGFQVFFIFIPYLGRWSNLTDNFSKGLVQPPSSSFQKGKYCTFFWRIFEVFFSKPYAPWDWNICLHFGLKTSSPMEPLGNLHQVPPRWLSSGLGRNRIRKTSPCWTMGTGYTVGGPPKVNSTHKSMRSRWNFFFWQWRFPYMNHLTYPQADLWPQGHGMITKSTSLSINSWIFVVVLRY